MASYSLVCGLLRALTIAGVATGGMLAALMAGPTSGPVVAVFPPWWDAAHSIASAASGGSVLGLGLRDFVVLLAPDEIGGRQRLWHAGAWLLLNPSGLVGCAVTTGATTHDIE